MESLGDYLQRNPLIPKNVLLLLFVSAENVHIFRRIAIFHKILCILYVSQHGKHCVMVYRNGCIDLAFDHSVCVWKMFQRLFSGKRQTTVEETKN